MFVFALCFYGFMYAFVDVLPYLYVHVNACACLYVYVDVNANVCVCGGRPWAKRTFFCVRWPFRSFTFFVKK